MLTIPLTGGSFSLELLQGRYNDDFKKEAMAKRF